MKLMFLLPHAMELQALTQPWELSVSGVEQTVMAIRAEELGYDMIAVPEHFVVPHTHVEYRVRITSIRPSPKPTSPGPRNAFE